MTPICVGISHRSAGLSLLERLAVAPTELPELLGDLVARPYVAEAVLLSTCNRVEVFARVTGFHGGLADLAAGFAARAGLQLPDLAPHLHVYYDEAAVRHIFRVAAGLDSMVVGEAQILGQLRQAYGVAVGRGCAGPLLHELMQQALRVGKRARAETGIDRAGQSVVTAAIDRTATVLGTLTGRSALVVGAGAMGALATAALRRAGAGQLFVANRRPDRAERLAAAHGASAVPLRQLAPLLAVVDLVVTATAAPEPLLLAADLLAARPSGAPLVVCDLAMPRNVGPCVAELPWITSIDIEELSMAARAGARVGQTAEPDQVTGAVPAAAAIVEAEVAAFVTWLRGQTAAPTVAALRARADDLVAAELSRLHQRRTELTEDQRAEISNTIHRIVGRLLHQPSVRVRKLAAEPGGERYARALRELFDLRVPATQAADVTAAAGPLAITLPAVRPPSYDHAEDLQ